MNPNERVRQIIEATQSKLISSAFFALILHEDPDEFLVLDEVLERDRDDPEGHQPFLVSPTEPDWQHSLIHDVDGECLIVAQFAYDSYHNVRYFVQGETIVTRSAVFRVLADTETCEDMQPRVVTPVVCESFNNQVNAPDKDLKLIIEALQGLNCG